MYVCEHKLMNSSELHRRYDSRLFAYQVNYLNVARAPDKAPDQVGLLALLCFCHFPI